jgi:hypothetical protein
MKIIDLQRIRETLPKHGTARLYKKEIDGKTICYIECWIKHPSLCEMYPISFEKDFEMIKDWQKDIVGDALSEIFTEQTGHEWRIYFKRVPLEFINLTDDDLVSYTGFTKEQLTAK